MGLSPGKFLSRANALLGDGDVQVLPGALGPETGEREDDGSDPGAVRGAVTCPCCGTSFLQSEIVRSLLEVFVKP